MAAGLGGEAVTVPDLVKALARQAGVPRYQAGFFLRALVLEVRAALAGGEAVTLHGLGTLQVKECSSRVTELRGRTVVTPGRKVSFHPSKSLRSAVL